MRKLLIAVTTAGLLAVAGPAFADHPTGDSEFGNQVRCGSGSTVGHEATSIQVNAKDGTVVLCNDDTPDGAAPIQGRIIVNTSEGWVAADGDADNDPQAQGWARLDVGTGGAKVRCGGADGGGYNAEYATGGKQEYCG